MTQQEEQSISVLIVDDERLGREVVSHMLEKHSGFSLLGECANGVEALDSIKELKPDLVFLDIKMPGMSGMELSERLDDSHRPVVVFITAYDAFAVDAFEQNALDYLLKPFDQGRFDQMIQRVRRRFEQKEEASFAKRLKGFLSTHHDLGNPSSRAMDRIVVKESGRVFFVDPYEVDYFEASGNYVALHVDGKSHLVYDTLTKMEGKLDPQKFLRIHRSTIVNLGRIRELQPHFNGEYVVILKSGDRLKLSRSYKDVARARLGLE